MLGAQGFSVQDRGMASLGQLMKRTVGERTSGPSEEMNLNRWCKEIENLSKAA
jgi:hypothetical protein